MADSLECDGAAELTAPYSAQPISKMKGVKNAFLTQVGPELYISYRTATPVV